jgi:Protein of unknown function (DUF3631)/Bifunctional DNA primase/polymerase, N-terminal
VNAAPVVELVLPDLDGKFPTPLDGALFMASLGIPQTPLRARTKAPFLPEFPKTATTDAVQIREWAKTYPECNFGSVGREGEFFVFEADSTEVRKRFEATSNQFTSKLIVASRTGRGHRWYRHTAGVRNIQQSFTRHGDFSVRAENMQCVSPGSLHPDTGEQYRLISTGAPDVPSAAEIAFWESERVEKKDGKKEVPRNERGKVSHGNIHGWLLHRAGQLRHTGLEQDEIETVLLREVHEQCEAPIDEVKVIAMAKSICNFPVGEDKSLALTQTTVTDAGAALVKDALDKWLEKDSTATLENDEVFNYIAVLSPSDYETYRKRITKKLGWARPATLDKEREQRIPEMEKENENLQGQAVVIENVEPWDEPVDINAVLDEIESTLNRFVFFWRKEDVVAVSLWCAMTWLVDALGKAPYLGIRSPEKECGKSTLLSLVSSMVYHPMGASNVTSASVFRLLDMYTLTLLVDELDTFLKLDPQFAGIMNSGHSRALGRVVRIVGEDLEPRWFNTFGPKAYGMIGSAVDTLESRSIPIILYPKIAEDGIENLDMEENPELVQRLKDITRKLARWAKDHGVQVTQIKPNMGGFTNRKRDNWRPLMQIAQFASPRWVGKARLAAGLGDPTESKNDNRLFIEDVRNIFHTRNTDYIPSNVMLSDLHAQEESGWSHYGKGNDGMTQKDLAGMMKVYGIKAERGRLGNGRLGVQSRGYHIAQFESTFQRFLFKFEPEDVALGKVSTPELEAAKAAKGNVIAFPSAVNLDSGKAAGGAN